MLLRGLQKKFNPFFCFVLKRNFWIDITLKTNCHFIYSQRRVLQPLSLLTYTSGIVPSTFKSNYCTHEGMADNKFIVGYAKLGTSGCKKCKTKIEKGALRIGKVTANPFSSDGDMKQWYHPDCIFETFKRARATTKKIEEPDDLEGFGDLKQEDKDRLNDLMKGTY